jgi:hypothetical protein
MQKFVSTIDHLVITASTLESGTAWIEQQLGCSLQPGGQHPRMGTHNRLLRIGADCYVEVIAIDPSAVAPGQRRWFGLDQCSALSVPRLTTWVMRTSHIHEVACLSVVDPGPIQAMQRGELEWLITIPEDGECRLHGTLPSLIQWKTWPPPATRLPESTISLQRLELRHPMAAELERWLQTAGFSGPVDLIAVCSGEPAGLTAVLRRQMDGREVRLESPVQGHRDWGATDVSRAGTWMAGWLGG